MCTGERQELSDLLDAATQRVDRLETANVQHGSKEASLKDKVGQPHFQSTMHVQYVQNIPSPDYQAECFDGTVAVIPTQMHLFA